MSGLVLVVDDEARNRKLARQLLEVEGYLVEEAENGAEALDRAVDLRPDVVLLDVMMPVMNGLEACRQLKANEHTAEIPVVLVTALKDREDRLQGIEAGADDFLSKPVDRQELLLRVRNSVRARRLYDRLGESYRHLREVEKLRDDLTHMIAHDMRTPLTGIMLSLEMVEMRYAESMLPRHRELLANSARQAAAVVRMIDSMIDVSRLESDCLPLELAECDLREVVEGALAGMAALVPDWARVEVSQPAEPVPVRCDGTVIGRVVGNLLGNALKYTQAGAIRVVVSGPRVEVVDSGPGVPEAHRQRIFEKFGRVGPEGSKMGHSTGLGLTFCKLAIEAHGGEIGVDSVVGQGSTFWFTLPGG